MNEMGRRTSLRAALVLVAAGTAAGLLAAEGSIVLIGRAYHAYRLGAAPGGGGSPRVLAVGDSFTFGLGAPRHRGYPEQLAELLWKGGRNPGLRVVNRGIPGLNSSQLAKNLDGWLDRDRPDILLVLIGDNNPNLTGSHFHLLAPGGTYGRADFLSRLDIRLQRSRLYRMVRLARLMGRFRSWRRRRPAPASDNAFREGVAHYERGAYEEARAAFARSVGLDPGRADARARLGQALYELRRFAQARRSFEKALELDPFDGLASGFINALPAAERPGVVEAYAGDLLRGDLERIADLARSRGVALVLQTYPHPNPFTENVPRELAREWALPLADHAAAFGKLAGTGKAKGHLSGDSPNFLGSHPNERGYGVMAGTLADALRSAGLVE